METLAIPKKNRRHFLKENFLVESWEDIQSFYEALQSRVINSKEDLRQWFKDRSELDSAISEDMGWRYIRMTGDTANKELVDRFNYFVSEIQPKIAPYSNSLNEKALKSPYLKELKETGYAITVRSLQNEFEIYREKNIPLFTEIEQEAQQYGAISGAMTVEMEGKELTLQQAADYLQSPDRKIREEAYLKISERRHKDKDTLDALFNDLLMKRNQVALNADFKNFRDYMFKALGRFDYTPEDCFNFHQAVSAEVVPVLDLLARERKEALKIDSLKPWDLNVNYLGSTPLKPFNDGEELLNKTIECFSKIDFYLGQCLKTMKTMGHLDLVSRKGKAPGGYNYPLDESGVPFIFMNATTTLRDLVTMVHEGGHALHSFVTNTLELNTFKHPPSEVAELASMSMELISMEYWEIFFPDRNDLIRAKKEHLEGIIQTLPWVATVDKFQHWIYQHPLHTVEQRKSEWNKIYSEFSNRITDWTEIEKYRDYIWQKQLHIYEVPFYYIEYAIAQLGAIAVWKNYKKDSKKGFENYLNALKLGYTRPIREIYQAAGIKFDFSQEYIRELISFVKEELDGLKA